MLFVKCDALSRASNLLVVCARSGLLLFVKCDVFSGASGFFVRGLFLGPVTGLLVRAAVFCQLFVGK